MGGPPACPLLGPYDAERDDDQRDREHGRRGAIEPACVLGIDHSRERVEAHQGDRSEVRECVEGREKGPGPDGGAQQREGHGAEHSPGGGSEAASRLLEGRVEPLEGGCGDQVDVGKRRQGERQPGTGKAVEEGDGDSREVGHQPARSCGREKGQSKHIGRDHQRQEHQDSPQARRTEVGTNDDPGGGDPDHGGRRGHEERQECRPKDEFGGARVEQNVPGAVGSSQDPGQHRCNGHPDRHENEQPGSPKPRWRGATGSFVSLPASRRRFQHPANLGRLDLGSSSAGPIAHSNPASATRSVAVSSSVARSERSTAGVGIDSRGGRPDATGTPGTRGYS